MNRHAVRILGEAIDGALELPDMYLRRVLKRFARVVADMHADEERRCRAMSRAETARQRAVAAEGRKRGVAAAEAAVQAAAAKHRGSSS